MNITKIVLLLVLAMIVNVAVTNAQSSNGYFKFEVGNIPGLHIWDNYTDYSESGSLTHSEGSRDWDISSSRTINYKGKYVYRSADTLSIQLNSSIHGRLLLIFDTIPLKVRTLTLFTYEDLSGGTGTTHNLSIENVTFHETPSTFEFSLSGNQILHHQLHDSSWKKEYLISSNQSFTTIYVTKKDSVVAGSFVSFAISKDHFQTSVSGANQLQDISVSPNPTSGLLSIHNAPKNTTSVVVMNILGEKVTELNDIRLSNFTLDLSTVEPGVYYAKFLTGNSVVVKKIIKQ